MLGWFHPFTEMFYWLMGSSQVTAESSMDLLVIEHLSPTGRLVERAKVFLFQLKRLYWETFRDSELTWKQERMVSTPLVGKQDLHSLQYQIVLRISKQCCVKPWEAQLSCHSGSGQDSLKAYPRPLTPQRWGKCEMWPVKRLISTSKAAKRTWYSDKYYQHHHQQMNCHLVYKTATLSHWIPSEKFPNSNLIWFSLSI